MSCFSDKKAGAQEMRQWLYTSQNRSTQVFINFTNKVVLIMQETLSIIAGWFLIFWGIFLLLKFRKFSAIIEELINSKPLFYTVCSLYTLAGIIIVVLHNIWFIGPRLLLTLLGWAMLIEGATYCLLPHQWIKKWAKNFYHPNWWLTGGILSTILGTALLFI